MSWTQEKAIDLCWRIELIAPECGAHIALTGGCLYKDGERKDLDIVVYRIRQVKRIDRKKFFSILGAIDIVPKAKSGERPALDGFVVKCDCGVGRTIDFLFPESEGGSY